MTLRKIDTHHHFLPKLYADAVGLDTLARMQPDGKAPDWSPELALAMMERHDIELGILSISSGPKIPDAPILLRRCNDEAARLRARFPGRFGSFASLPLPDIDACLLEIEYAQDSLDAQGFIIFTNYDGSYLGDVRFAPVLEELNRRRSTILIHPNTPPYSLSGDIPISILEFPFETTRTAASLIFSGAITKYRDIRFILSHAGGTLPYLTQRLAGAIKMSPRLSEMAGDPMAALREFYYDTALSVSAPSLAALLAVASPSRILYGTDFPMAPTQIISKFTQELEATPMKTRLKESIFCENAKTLLGL